MNSKKLSSVFFLAFLIFYSIPYTFWQGLDFYSRIDDAGNSLADGLTKRNISNFGSFRDFAKTCRWEAVWLDAEKINQELLENANRGHIDGLVDLYYKNYQKTPSVSEIEPIRKCLSEEYQKIRAESQKQADSLEVASAIGIFMDGDTNNSDFDIISDINKINHIIFTEPYEYDWMANKNKDFLQKFLAWERAELLGQNNNSHNNASNPNFSGSGQNIVNISADNGNSQNSGSQISHTEQIPPWAMTCTPEGYEKIAVSNMVSEDFLTDLNAVLSGEKIFGNNSGGQDYSQNIRSQGNNNSQKNENSSGTSLEQWKDFSNKLPCNGIFCITIGTNIQNHKLLGWGANFAIETILDAHIKKTENISWSDLSAQKMTNNSFQLPFLNTKFASKVAWGSVFMHNSPQISKKLEEENTPQKTQDEFEKMYRCALMTAWLSTDENKNSSIMGWGFLSNSQVNSQTLLNLDVPLNAYDETQMSQNSECKNFALNEVRRKNFSGFSSEINEISAFTTAMLDIIHQILDTERKLDTVPVR